MTKTDNKWHVETYHERTIDLTHDHLFRVTGVGFDDDAGKRHHQHFFHSLREAEEAIDAKIALIAKEKKTAENLKLEAYDDNGKEVILRGVHQGTGDLLGLVEADHAYPRLPWIGRLLAERKMLAARVSEINNKIRPFGISRRRGYGRIKADDYDRLIELLKKEYAEALAEAKKATPT